MFRNNNILNGLLALVFTFILGYIGLIFINKIFKDMVTTLDLKVKNEQARYKITEFILKEISSMEANYYKMFIFTDTKDLQNIEKEIKKEIDDIKNAIKILTKGGILENHIKLNLIEATFITDKIEFTPSLNQKLTLEKINLSEKLNEIEQKIEQIKNISSNITTQEKIIQINLLATSFTKIKENAIKLLYYSRKNKQLAEKNIQLLIQEQSLKESQQSRLISYLQVQTLQSQLNPHFVFNALDVVNNKIKEENIETAGELMVDLSKLMRRFLESSIHLDINDQKTEHTLKDELNLLESYIRFERLQYDKFDYKLEIADDIELENTYIPPMLIQPYIENAIKHGLMYKKEGRGILQLSIYKSDNETIIYHIIDNGVGRKAAKAIQDSHLKMYKSRGTEIVEKRIKVMQEMGIGISVYTEDISSGGTKVTLEIDV